MRVSATTLKNKLGQYLEAAMREPVIVEKSGRPVSVILSYQEYERFIEMEDQVWGLCAMQAAKEGYLGAEESAELLKQLEKRIKDEEDSHIETRK